MAASVAMSAGAGCSRPPPENIVPHTHQQTAYVPGVPRYYATSLLRFGYGMGVLVRSDDGRPTKIEGNPDHPASLGATDAVMQAELLSLYDPARSSSVRRGDTISDWDSFALELRSRIGRLKERRGEGLHIVLPSITSPTALRLIDRVRELLPAAVWYRDDGPDLESAARGAELATGRALHQLPRLGGAEAIVALDCDLFGPGPWGARCIRDFSEARSKARSSSGTSPVLLVAEPVPTCTGARAEYRAPVRRSRIPALAVALGGALNLRSATPNGSDGLLSADERAFVDRAAAELRRAWDGGAILVGHTQPPPVHALALSINAALGSLGRCLGLVEPVDGLRAFARPLHECVSALESGAVDTLLVAGVNPVYCSPLGARLAAALPAASASVHLGLYRDETGVHCSWHAPLAHELECWGDARAFDGAAGIIQPLTHPLYGGRSLLWMLALLAEDPASADQELVQETWRSQSGPADWNEWWRGTLKAGVVAGSAFPPVNTPVRTPTIDASAIEGGAEAAINLDSRVLDGRYATNAWLRELPDPITQLTWENAASVGPGLARDLGMEDGDVLRLSTPKATIEIPALIVPGVADGTIGLALGFGRLALGPVVDARGTDVRPLVEHPGLWVVGGVKIERRTTSHSLALAQLHGHMQGREIVRVRRSGETVPSPGPVVHLPLYKPNRPASAQQWGMSIDLAACVGCGACVVACQAENNVPVVGPEEVMRGRRMHWLRVDRYFEGGRAEGARRDASDVEIIFQPLACVHCEQAPCELVCPTGATQHSNDGLNEMNYARCIGTRYCSNNCPYKVRRFNFFRYADDSAAAQRMRNPRVTSRGRGVMEKCTYCVQRIRTAEFDARTGHALIPDGAVIPACQQACPARAIVFGDVNDPSSRVSALKRDARAYALLGELNTVPRTTYLADIRPSREEAGG